jgi:Mg2+-importing ATPase
LDNAGVIELLQTSLNGLDSAEVEARLKASGPNLIAQEGAPTLTAELWARAKSPLNALLLGLAAASYFLGEIHSSIVIAIIVALAVTMAFVQEHRSNEAAAKLRSVVKTRASVKRRGGQAQEAVSSDFQEVPLEELVPGDIVRLSAGDIIPADLRLLQAKDLFVDQAALSGEAMPVEKSAQFVGETVCDLLSIPNICLMGGSVVSGFATAVVVHTGGKTYFGQLASRVVSRRQLTSFEKGVNRFIRLMVYFMLALAPTVFLINGLTKGD